MCFGVEAIQLVTRRFIIASPKKIDFVSVGDHCVAVSLERPICFFRVAILRLGYRVPTIGFRVEQEDIYGHCVIPVIISSAVTTETVDVSKKMNSFKFNSCLLCLSFSSVFLPVHDHSSVVYSSGSTFNFHRPMHDLNNLKYVTREIIDDLVS